MTPQERELITELFDRLASLEQNPRDSDAEAAIRDGLRRAPNAMYALVQTVLVQDEALKAANARIQDYEQGGEPAQEQQPRSFLDSMRDSLFGASPSSRGSVPRVPQGGMAAAPAGSYRDAPPPSSGYGGSFLGTAAAAAAGVIGGSLLMNGIRSALGGYQGGPFSTAFDHLGGRAADAPWSDQPGHLAHDAGIDDITGSRSSFLGQTPQEPADDTQGDAFDDTQDDDGFDTGGDSDTA